MSGVAGEDVLLVPARTVRLACRCAECIDEFTGKAKLQPWRVPRDVVADRINPTGNYAVTIHWSDGHESIMAYAVLERVARKHADQQRPKGTQCVGPPDLEW
mmetsp:Transcript_26844/g.77067  ORF Transcript_26844/g.77067 Transcript_26844/m.77067 type:complete len:102 (+) Transcript_26844:3-308(+)